MPSTAGPCTFWGAGRRGRSSNTAGRRGGGETRRVRVPRAREQRARGGAERVGVARDDRRVSSSTVLYTPIVSLADLPPVGEGRESATLDLKQTVQPDKPDEGAKDIAAFANHFGGTLLVGAVEGPGGAIERYSPMREEVSERIRAMYSRAVAQLCSPRPIVRTHVIAIEGGNVIACNVDPVLVGLVGVRADPQGHSWRFPIRTGKDTFFLDPEHLAMYFEPKLRRHVMLLERIGKSDVVHVVAGTKNYDGYHEFRGRIASIDVDSNTVTFNYDGSGPRQFPLDHVKTIYRGGQTENWRIRFVSDHPSAA